MLPLNHKLISQDTDFAPKDSTKLHRSRKQKCGRAEE